MTPGQRWLSRSELGHVADVLERLVGLHGGSRRLADDFHLPHDVVGQILGRPASLRVLPETLHDLAVAAGTLGAPVTAEQLLAGDVAPLPPTIPLWQLAGVQRGWLRPDALPAAALPPKSGRFASSTRHLLHVRRGTAR